MKNKKEKGNVRRELKVLIFLLKKMLSISKGYILAVVASSVIKSGIPFVAILFPKFILDELLGQRRIETLIVYVVLGAGIPFVLYLTGRFFDRYLNIKSQDVINRIQADTGALMMGIAFENLENPEFTDFKERAMFPVETRGILYEMTAQIPDFLKYAITFVGTLGIIITFDWVIILIMLALVAVATLISAWFSARRLEIQKLVGSSNKIYSYYIRTLRNPSIAKDVRLYDCSDFLMDKVKDNDLDMLKIARRSNFSLYTHEGVKAVLAAVQSALAYGYIAVFTIINKLTVGSFSMYITSAAVFSDSLTKLFESVVTLRQNCRWLFDYMDLCQTPVESEKKGDSMPEDVTWIEFRNVSFRYPKTDKLILNDINIKIKGNERLSIVGRNGAGKTTFIKLLARLYEPTSGDILLNGVNINKIDYNEYMAKVAVVFQDFMLFEFTVAENIVAASYYDRKNVNHENDEKLASVLEKAGLTDTVAALPGKMQTYIGKRFEKEGMEFSGGQMQKIAIARALYKESGLAALDEPTAALDPFAEAEIYERLNDFIKDRTAIYISHRLSSCKFCDRIILIDEGSIKEEGSHEDLMHENGLYAQMFRIQAEKYT